MISFRSHAIYKLFGAATIAGFYAIYIAGSDGESEQIYLKSYI
jgi:hypothetical protein